MTLQRIVPLLASLVAAGFTTIPASSASPVIIGEFMARNTAGLRDDDGDRSDWIELRNRSDAPVNLDGWFLTDSDRNLRRWRLPAVNLPAQGHLVVFASGKDRRDPERPLHANFQLAGSGEYLALVEPDGTTVATQFAPQFPEQLEDISYGSGITATTNTLLAEGASARFTVPSDGSLGTTWTGPSFDDGDWTAGTTGLGFASPSTLVGTALLAYWPLREGSGSVASNLVSGGAHGVLHGATWTHDPVRGTVLDFNGRDSYVAAGTLPRMGITSNFTWSCWYRQRSTPNLNAVILGNRAGGADGTLQFIKLTPSAFEYYRDGNSGFVYHPLANGPWRHLAVVKQGTAINYYDNGSLVGSARAGANIDSNPFYLGGDPGYPGEYIDGLIDDVSLWSRALDPTEVLALARGTSPLTIAGPGSYVATDLGSPMRGRNASAYVRLPFEVPVGTRFDSLRLRIRYDDGFVAYLNGTEVARRLAPSDPAWNSTATGQRPAIEVGTPETIDLTADLGRLVDGPNVLALHGLNLDPEDDDLLLLPELEAVTLSELGPRYFAPPTPGSLNDGGALAVVADLAIDHPHGYYDAPFELTLSCPTPGVTIRYTLDGTEPGPDAGLTYQAPLSIRSNTVLRAAAYRPGYLTRRSLTRTYLFLDQVLVQTGAGLPTAWGRDWEMDPRVVTHPDYAGRIRDDLRSLPVVCLSFDPQGFWGLTGIYTQSTGRGDEYERPASVELFFPDGSRPGFQVNCGVQIVGGASRAMSPKRGLGLVFKSRYGPAKLRYKFFDDSPVEEFDFLAFRPNFNMSWVRTDGSGPLNNANADGVERLHAIYVRDQFTKESQLAMGHPGAHERFVHLYLNGIYWGLYNPSERTDARFAAAYLGGDDEDYDAIFSDSSSVPRAHDGDKDAWLEMMHLAGQGLASPEAYARIREYLDVVNLADYMMLNFYCATVDWPWQNWNAVRKREPGAGFRFLIWDAEYTLETPPWVPDDRTDVGAAGSDADSPARLYHELRRNEEWRLLFADRVQRHFFGDGALTPDRTSARFLRLCDLIDGAIVAESARWGDFVRRSKPYTRNEEWLAEKNRLLTEFFPNRTERVVQQLIRAGLYPSVPAPVPDHPGGTVDRPLDVGLRSPAGRIHFTTDGSDPRLPGGAVSPTARPYVGPIPVDTNRRLLARTLLDRTWSALLDVTFAFTEPAPRLEARLVGTAVVIAWPDSATGFVLESTETLSPPAWTPVPNVTGRQHAVNAPTTHRYFRLRRPGD